MGFIRGVKFDLKRRIFHVSVYYWKFITTTEPWIPRLLHGPECFMVSILCMYLLHAYWSRQPMVSRSLTSLLLRGVKAGFFTTVSFNGLSIIYQASIFITGTHNPKLWAFTCKQFPSITIECKFSKHSLVDYLCVNSHFQCCRLNFNGPSGKIWKIYLFIFTHFAIKLK